MPTVIDQMKIPGTLTAGNRFKVAKKEWSKWTVEGRRLFNYLFHTMRANQRIFTHPKAVQLPAAQWQTTAWNAAWEAARHISRLSQPVVVNVRPT